MTSNKKSQKSSQRIISVRTKSTFPIPKELEQPKDVATLRYLISLQERINSTIKSFTSRQRAQFDFEAALLRPNPRTELDRELASQLFRHQSHAGWCSYLRLVNFTLEKLVAGGTTEIMHSSADYLPDEPILAPFLHSLKPDTIMFGRISYLDLHITTSDPLKCPLKNLRFRCQLLTRVNNHGEICVPLYTDDWRFIQNTTSGAVRMAIDLRAWKKVPNIVLKGQTLQRLKHKADDYLMQIHVYNVKEFNPAQAEKSYSVWLALPRCRVIGSETKTPAALNNVDVVTTEMILQIAEEISLGTYEFKNDVALAQHDATGFDVIESAVIVKKSTKQEKDDSD